MKKFILEKDFLEIFPNVKIGVLVLDGINNNIVDENKFASYLRDNEKLAAQYFSNPEFSENPVIKQWRDAFRNFKTKKGARCSIEALLKRVSNGNQIGTIIPLVDIYNGISLKYGVPVGGEDIDKFQGNIRLTLADGDEDFVTYGSDKSEPPYAGEVIYKDDAGAICRCWNWREAVRTMLTEATTRAFMIIESVGENPNLEPALDELAELVKNELGGNHSKFILDKNNSEIVIEE